ncbi:MAG: PEP-CTERM sorting domain-containing protein [Planctomycetia bacterium]|nr:PEP-CTERM sorting domain-containing protein [Planctomycetia bacterium]
MARKQTRILLLLSAVAMFATVAAGPAAGQSPPSGIETALDNIPDNGNTGRALDVLDFLNGSDPGRDRAWQIRDGHADGAGLGPIELSAGGLGVPLDHVPDNGNTIRAWDVLTRLGEGTRGKGLAPNLESSPSLGGDLTIYHNPEPATIGLMTMGIAAVFAARRKRRK